MVSDVVYFLTDPDEDTVLRLYVPKHLRALIIEQYHGDYWPIGFTKGI